MSRRREIGKLSERRGDLEVEWTIDDIFSFSKEDEFYRSPQFSVSGCNFCLQIYPYGEIKAEAVGWISLYLYRISDSQARTNVNFAFGVKKADGTVQKLRSEFNWAFDRTVGGYGSPKLLERSELLRQRSELAPSNKLTLTCSLRVNDGFDFAERTDTLSKNFKDAFLSKQYCDVTVKVKNETFPVHKFVLAARSPVYDAMLRADMEEKQTGVVNIVDCDPKPFKDFLMYVYSGKLENFSSNAFELYKVADKYQVQELKEACVGYIAGNLSEENVREAILLAHQFDDSRLKEQTQKYFDANFLKIVSSAAWESLMTENFHAANEFLKNAASKMELVE